MTNRRYAGLAFFSAFLLFLVQPLISKAILPWFGGVPSVWTTAMLFFQVTLIGGYALAHTLARLAPRRQATVHLVLLGISLLVLPIIPAESWKPPGSESPVWWILALLAVTVGAPYLLLANTAPLVQEWFRRDRAAAPHTLYAWSNAGSLGALVFYPLVAEPLLSVHSQAWLWSLLYIGWVAACGWLAFTRGRTGSAPAPELPTVPPSAGAYAWWLALSMCGSGLLLAVTNDVNLHLPAAPFIWIIPLALYLLSFVLAFSGWYRAGIARILVLVVLLVLAWMGIAGNIPLGIRIGASLFALFTACLNCHGELHRSSPPEGAVTPFYLCIAIGGALGGILVAIVSPAVFTDFWELPILLLGAGLVVAAGMFRDRIARRVRAWEWVAVALALWFIAGGLVTPRLLSNRRSRFVERNFYGVGAVFEDISGDDPMRRLRHGGVIHGTQFLTPARRLVPATYFAEGSGIGIAIRKHPRRRAGQPLAIGVVGLGVGTIAAYGTERDSIRFYEIDPAMVDIAHNFFTFVDFGLATTDVVLGDGRLSLEREVRSASQQHRLDVLVLDAFSSGAPPVHLLTEEAMRVYWTALKPDGILAVNASTRYLNLAGVLRHHADETGKTLVRVQQEEAGEVFASVWLLATSNRAFLDTIDIGPRTRADLPAESPVRWTDGYSSLLSLVPLTP